MRHWAGIFSKLGAAHDTHVIDAVNRARAQVRAELLIAEDRQPLFQAELEPVATGDTVTGPVMEVFVTNDRLDAEVVFIRGRFRFGQHIFGVKDVQPFIFHCAHIEEVDGDDHKDVEVILQAKTLLIPFHAVFQRGHRPVSTIKVATIDKDFQGNVTTRTGFEAVAQHIEIAGDNGKQIAGFWEGIVPLHPVTAIFHLPAIHAVTVRQQVRIECLFSNNRRGKTCQHVRAIKVPGNMAETFSFTLGTECFTGFVQPFQRSVFIRMDIIDDF